MIHPSHMTNRFQSNHNLSKRPGADRFVKQPITATQLIAEQRQSQSIINGKRLSRNEFQRRQGKIEGTYQNASFDKGMNVMHLVMRPRQTSRLPPIQQPHGGRAAAGYEKPETAYHQRQTTINVHRYGPQNVKEEHRRRHGMCKGTYSEPLNKVAPATQSVMQSERKPICPSVQKVSNRVAKEQNQRYLMNHVHRFDGREARDTNKVTSTAQPVGQSSRRSWLPVIQGASDRSAERVLGSEEKRSQPRTNFHRVGRQEVCEARNQFRRRQGVCESIDGTKEQRTFTRVLYKRF